MALRAPHLRRNLEHCSLFQESGSYIYVYIMGTLPEYQSRGLGSALLSHISAIADSKRVPCYLEVIPCLC